MNLVSTLPPTMTSEDRAGPKGLKRLSLTPGARAPISTLSSPRTPNSAGLVVETSLPSPLSHNRRFSARRTSSISYYNSASIAPSPTSSSSDSFARSPIPPTIHESPVAVLQSTEGLRRSVSLPKRTRNKLSVDKRIVAASEAALAAQPPNPPPQTLAEK